MSEEELIQLVAKAVRAADATFERVGGSTRHWVRDCLLPALRSEKLHIVGVSDTQWIAISVARHIAVTEFAYEDSEKTMLRLRSACKKGAIHATREFGGGWHLDRQSLYDWLGNPNAHKPGPRKKTA